MGQRTRLPLRLTGVIALLLGCLCVRGQTATAGRSSTALENCEHCPPSPTPSLTRRPLDPHSNIDPRQERSYAYRLKSATLKSPSPSTYDGGSDHVGRLLLQEEDVADEAVLPQVDVGINVDGNVNVDVMVNESRPGSDESQSEGAESDREERPPCYLDTDVPQLVSVQTWRSRKTKPRESITLMTQLSDDRLSMLENQCRTWNDPIVAMVYVPLFNRKAADDPIVPTYSNTTLTNVIEGIDAFFYFMEMTAPCVLTIELVGEFMDPLDPVEYPINALRNRAIKLAKTDVLFMLDVDFVPATDLGMPSPGYRDPVVYDQLIKLTSERKALVLPAFEITNRKQELAMGQNFARKLALSGKQLMRDYYLAGMVDAFNGADAPWGHGPTQTSKWVTIMDTPMTYRAHYQPKYEPFLILGKSTIPWCDERFVGYGGNKIAYINQLRGEGFTFHVHPFGYTLHVPHPKTKAANTFVQAKRAGASEMDYLRSLVERNIADGVFVPHTGFCDYRRPDTVEADGPLSQRMVDEKPVTLIQHDD